MYSADLPGTVDRALLAAGTTTYESHDFETLDKVPESLRAVVETLRELGFFTVASLCLSPGIDDTPGVKCLK